LKTPIPFPVELSQHNPSWATDAKKEIARLITSIGTVITEVHHIGSTAIPGIKAKPILDLLPVVTDLGAFEKSQVIVENLGYMWWGEIGLTGRRYCTLNDQKTGRRTIQLHCYELGSPEITRHLAFRDYLTARPDLAHEYEAEKCRCRALHPDDSHAYTECKSAWIRRIEAEALMATGVAHKS
jgi:GrpB-like predicted nucleotidyltransferase (UPF0157 family)